MVADPRAGRSSGMTTVAGDPSLASIDGHAATVGAVSQAPPPPTGYGNDGTSVTPYGQPPTPLAAGTKVAGQYVVQSVLGRGGMGIVYRAHHLSLERAVALKLHGGGGGGSSTETQRLEREAKAMARLNHPNVIGVYDVGTHEGNLFIALELVDGGTLDDACGGRPWRGGPAAVPAGGGGSRRGARGWPGAP